MGTARPRGLIGPEWGRSPCFRADARQSHGTGSAELPPGGRTPALDEVTAIIVSYNSAHCAGTLGALMRDWPHVIVVDNGSEDGTPACMREAMPRARIVELGENLGFGRANNAALAWVTTPYALLVNPDCEVTAEAARALLASMAQWPRAAVMVPQLLGRDGTPQVNYGWVRHRGGRGAKSPAAAGVTSVGNACGAVMLLRLSALPTREWFDPRFFLYYEDEDLCLRLMEAGNPVLVEPAVRVKHVNRGSVRGRHPWRVEYGRGYHHARSKILFFAKHLGPARAACQRRLALLGALGMLLLWVFAPSPRHVSRLWGRIVGLGSAPVRY
ncbi:MAG: glycosyltransferase family 2 protein [Xenophilus sp.]